jgi:tRNA(Ile2) C34 agmatinyltransferase TiaS|tara:strand:+ start:5396 stop:5602 length:207 start_codon:yes stop_codon:yes gene_type:complete
MIALGTTIAAVLDKLLWILIAYRRTKEKGEAQIERDKISKSPSAWFANHFSNGLSKQSDKDSTDKTKS